MTTTEETLEVLIKVCGGSQEAMHAIKAAYELGRFDMALNFGKVAEKALEKIAA